MESADSQVLALNCGSSSIKFALYRSGDAPPRLAGKVDRIGLPGTTFRFADAAGERHTVEIRAVDRDDADEFLLDWLDERVGLASIRAVGHRVAHGGPRFADPQRVTRELIDELRRISAFAPEHLPSEIALIEACSSRLRRQVQVACFDTAFHRALPQVARLLPLPRRLQDKGIERYGFHGLSYAFLMEELARLDGADAVRRLVILAHLGNGASLAAVRDGTCIDTSMGFSPAGGIPMSTRSGDLDPGLVRVLAEAEQMNAEAFDHMVNRESGLLGVSQTSSDMRDLLEREANDVRAAEAIALFCYQVRKWIGAFAAALGGVDTLVFSGGIGENAPEIRARVCDGLAFLGIELDRRANDANATVVASAASRAGVYVIRTDEERMIARAVERVVGAEAR